MYAWLNGAEREFQPGLEDVGDARRLSLGLNFLLGRASRKGADPHLQGRTATSAPPQPGHHAVDDQDRKGRRGPLPQVGRRCLRNQLLARMATDDEAIELWQKKHAAVFLARR